VAKSSPILISVNHTAILADVEISKEKAEPLTLDLLDIHCHGIV
jgi:hypothetical protein